MPRQTRGDRAVQWIEKCCVYPSGPHRGWYVVLTPSQRETVHRIYDHAGGPQDIPVTDTQLASYIALLHVCGPEALQHRFRPAVAAADVFTMWSATDPRLKEVLKRDGERIVCPELGTQHPAAA
jgi:hypothetical protein